MISRWSDVWIWLAVLVAAIIMIYVLDFLKGWNDYQKRREKLIEEIRRRENEKN